MTPPTITAAEMRVHLGLSPKSIAAFNNHYVARFPSAFVVVQAGRAGNKGAALYDRKAFMRWIRQRRRAEQVLKGE